MNIPSLLSLLLKEILTLPTWLLPLLRPLRRGTRTVPGPSAAELWQQLRGRTGENQGKGGLSQKDIFLIFKKRKRVLNKKEKTWWLVYAGCGGRGDLMMKRFG